MATQKTVGQRVRWARENVALSQTALGKALLNPRSHAAVSDLERGLTRVDVFTLMDIAALTGNPLEWFLRD